MHRQSLDVGSVAALLLQTEASLSALHRPSAFRDEASCHGSDTERQFAPRSRGNPDGGQPLKRSGSSGAITARPAGLGNPGLEAQVLHLGASVGRLEQRLREERGLAEARRLGDERRLEAFIAQCETRLQSNEDGVEKIRRSLEEAFSRRLQEVEKSLLSVCERRSLVGEEQLRQVGETLRAATDTAVEDMRRRVDERFQEIQLSEGERSSTLLQEVREGLRQLQAASQGFEGRLEQCTLAEDVEDRLRLVDKALQKRLDDRLGDLESQTEERCAWLENGAEAMAQRCRELDRRLSERLSCQASLVDSVMEQLPGLLPFRQCQEQVYALSSSAEHDRQRLEACEACFSQLPALDAKVEEVREHVGKQLEEQAQTARCLRELAQRLPQNMPDGAVVEQRLAKQAEDQAQTARCLRELAQRLPQNLPDAAMVEQRLAKQADEQAQTSQCLRDLTQRLPQKLADVEQICQRAERQAASLEVRLHSRLDEDGGRVGKELEALQQRLAQRVDDAETRLQRTAARLEREGKEHMLQLSKQAEQAEGRLRELESQADRLVEAGIRQLQGSRSPASVAFDGKAPSGVGQLRPPEQSPRQPPQRSPQRSPQQLQPSPGYGPQCSPRPLLSENPNPFASGASATTLPYVRSYSAAEAAPMTPGLYGEPALHQPPGLPGGPATLAPGVPPWPREADNAECCGLF